MLLAAWTPLRSLHEAGIALGCAQGIEIVVGPVPLPESSHPASSCPRDVPGIWLLIDQLSGFDNISDILK